ncbi:MAG: hypothetical protein BWK73_14020 [Thiothrix lacustris]|uniref:Uncharacterized protein n=1 Tax=Thiothrix lacustris TaxID=525917 RepID=A0A1Y1QSI7_9GAMM|nr:MAG: hypothetical protein BWK73_14020 [Thiothrix lacustris]
MENQHRKISGYRELNQEEIDLMNEIKAKGRDLERLLSRVALMPVYDKSADTERQLWCNAADVQIRTGVMQLIRAVALPT